MPERSHTRNHLSRPFWPTRDLHLCSRLERYDPATRIVPSRGEAMRGNVMANAQPEDSSRTLSSPTQSVERNPAIDILRGFALFGILLVNFPGAEAARSGAADDVVSKLLMILVSGKFYTTFSFLFGLGFALQLLRAQSRGQRVVPVYIRRMLVLFLIGLGHAVLIWRSGDILLVYAFMGFFLIPFRNLSAKVLLPAALLVLAAGYCHQHQRQNISRSRPGSAQGESRAGAGIEDPRNARLTTRSGMPIVACRRRGGQEPIWKR